MAASRHLCFGSNFNVPLNGLSGLLVWNNVGYSPCLEKQQQSACTNFGKIKTANINVKNTVYHTVVRLTVIKQQISFVVWPSWGSLTPQLTEAAINRSLPTPALTFGISSSLSQYYIF